MRPGKDSDARYESGIRFVASEIAHIEAFGKEILENWVFEVSESSNLPFRRGFCAPNLDYFLFNLSESQSATFVIFNILWPIIPMNGQLAHTTKHHTRTSILTSGKIIHRLSRRPVLLNRWRLPIVIIYHEMKIIFLEAQSNQICFRSFFRQHQTT